MEIGIICPTHPPQLTLESLLYTYSGIMESELHIRWFRGARVISYYSNLHTSTS